MRRRRAPGRPPLPNERKGGPPTGDGVAGALSTSVQKGVSAGVAACFASSITYPLDKAKTRLQVKPDEYYGLIHCLYRIVREEGRSGLYTGIGSEYTKQTVMNITYYFWYELFKGGYFKYAKQRREAAQRVAAALGPADKVLTRAPETDKELRIGAWENYVIGFAAGVIAIVISNPIMVVQNRLQTRSLKAPDASMGFLRTGKYMFQKAGMGVFYAGLLPSLILCNNPAITNMVNDQLSYAYKTYKRRTRKQRTDGPERLEMWEIFVIGAISKLIATLLTYPYILSRARLQYRSEDPNAVKYTGVVHVIYHTIKNDGLAGLFAGLSANIFSTVLKSAIMYVAKDSIIEWAQGRMKPQVAPAD